MRKPLSPAEWDTASDYHKRKGVVPAVRPTEEEYAAQMAEYEGAQAASDAKSALVRKLEAAGGSYWNSDDLSRPRVYFNGIGEKVVSGYVDLKTGARIATSANQQAEFEAALRAKLGE